MDKVIINAIVYIAFMCVIALGFAFAFWYHPWMFAYKPKSTIAPTPIPSRQALLPTSIVPARRRIKKKPHRPPLLVDAYDFRDTKDPKQDEAAPRVSYSYIEGSFPPKA